MFGIKLIDNEFSRQSGINQALLKEINSCQTLYQINEWLSDLMNGRQRAKHPLTGSDKIVSHIVEIVNSDLTRHYSLEEMANIVGYSPPYLSQVFKKAVGQTFTNYLMNLRIHRAKHLLLTTDLKTFEISDQVGLENYRHFNKIFKRIVGMNPTKYRSQHVNPTQKQS